MTSPEKGKRARVLSGMRPTGRLHIGHYFGALQNWVRLQNEISDEWRVASGEKGKEEDRRAYECFYFIADWHALTSDYANTSAIAENTLQIMIDYLAAGLDPQKSVLFQQSVIPEHAELHLLLSMVTPLGWIERVPTYKEALENVKDRDLHNYGFLGYPVLQCADIVMYGNPGAALYIPVGEDQVSHVETSREIVRRFVIFFGKEDWARAPKGAAQAILDGLKHRLPAPGQGMSAEQAAELALRLLSYDERLSLLSNHKVPLVEILTEPESMVTSTPRIPGLDGRKMSKSYGNTIMLSESDADIRAKTKVMVTDPARKRRTDPGNPDVCPVYDWHKLFSAGEPGRLEWVRQGCTTAGIGCIECKAAMAENLIKWIAPVRERRVNYEKRPARVLEILDEGSKRARAVAQGTMERVREAVFGWEKKRKEIDGTAGSANA